MDIFDKYLFDELTMEYTKSNISDDDYEELYQRFCNMDYLPEVQPYLWVMRFWGLGTNSEKDIVLLELKEKLKEENVMLKGLYYDLLLSEDVNNTDAFMNLRHMIDEGYTNIFTKEKSSIKKVMESTKKIEVQEQSSLIKDKKVEADVVVDHIIFECGSYNGLYFTAADIDYLKAKVFLKPFYGKKHIKVRSQIFLNDESFSEVFSNEYDIDSNTRWLRTSGWGNKNYTCYTGYSRDGKRTYKWVIEIDGKNIFSQEFCMYTGKINKYGPKVNDVRLFASKASGALEMDRDNYKTTFDSTTLEYVYFKFLIDTPNESMIGQMFIKITCLEDNSVFTDEYVLYFLENDTIEFWEGVGFSEMGNWKKGLYRYSVRVGNATNYEGVFSVV